MAEEPDRLRQEIENTRASLTRDVDLLAEKTSPKKVAQRRWTSVKEKVMGTSEHARHAASDTAGTVQDKASSAVGTVQDKASSAAWGSSGRARRQTDRTIGPCRRSSGPCRPVPAARSRTRSRRAWPSAPPTAKATTSSG